MAWHLSETLTDVTLLPKALWRLKTYYTNSEFEPGTRAWRSFYRYLRDAGVNISQLGEEDVPEEHQGNIHRWMAADMFQLLRNLGYIEDEGTIQLTARGLKMMNSDPGFESGLCGGLFYWQMGKSERRPAHALLETLARLDAPEAVPCPGLMLPEFIKTMNLLDEGNTAENCLRAIHSWRHNALDGNLPAVDSAFEEIMRARMQVCDYLANEDETIWRDLGRGRTTQIIILASGMAVYGGLLDDVQFMALNRPFLTALEERQPKGFKDVFQWLQSLSPVDAAQEAEHALSSIV